MEGQKKQTVKVVFVGAPESGKSCLVHGYTQVYKPTVGVDYAAYEFKIDNKMVRFQLWDISASMTFNEKSYDHCKNGDIVACVYAANDRESFINCQDLVERLLKEDKLKYNAKAAIVATKIDLERLVSFQQGYSGAQILKSSPTSFTQTYFQLSTKEEKYYLPRLCEGFYRILKDQSIKTLVQIDQQYADTAPPIPVVQPIKLDAQPQKKPQFNKLLKILVKGEEKCGKSALIRRFAHNQTISDYIPTIGVDFAIKVIQIQEVKVKLQLWDTAGMHKFKIITNCYIKGCQGFIILYDCTNIQTFKQVTQHADQVQKQCIDSSKIVRFLVANKVDLKQQRVVSKQEGQQLAKQLGYEYMQVSALENAHVDELFYNISDRMIKNGVV